MARVIVVAEREIDPSEGFAGDRRAFHLKERVTSCDMRDPHVAGQLIERIGWALADAEDVESRREARHGSGPENAMTELTGPGDRAGDGPRRSARPG